MLPVAHFNKIIARHGETVTIYTAMQTFNSDSGSVKTSSDGTASASALVQPGSAAKHLAPQGIPKVESVFLAFKNDVTILADSNVLINSKRYRIVALEEVRDGGATHHYEAYAELNR